MSRIMLPDGDLQLADYPFRMNQGVTTIVYYLTERCNFRCSFCVGWNKGGKDCLTDRFEVSRIAGYFRSLRDASGLEQYIWLTGGEPSLATNFCELVRSLTRHSHIELQTNLCTRQIQEFANTVDPARVGEVMATYHPDTVESNRKLEKLYFDNFALLTAKGFSVVFKIVAMPKKLEDLAPKLDAIRRRLPDQTPVLLQPFISGATGPKERPMGYPYLYSHEDRQLLAEMISVRRREIFDYIGGAGWFYGMRCDAGRGFIAMNKDGGAYRCVADMVTGHNCLGSLMDGTIRLLAESRKCYQAYCQAPFWGLWYGTDPWEFIGAKQENRRYSRFSIGTTRRPSRETNNGDRAQPPLLMRDDGRAIRSDKKAIFRANSRIYEEWARQALEQGDLSLAGKYTLLAWRSASTNLRLWKPYLKAALPWMKGSR